MTTKPNAQLMNPRVEAIRDRWDGDRTGRYSTATEEADYRDVHYLLAEVDRLARQVEAVTTLRDRVSGSVAIAAQEGRSLTPVVALADLNAVLSSTEGQEQ